MSDSSFVLFPMGEKHFALPADRVTELAQVDQPQTVPHTTPFLTGVLVRRGEVIPVWDIAPSLESLRLYEPGHRSETA